MAKIYNTYRVETLPTNRPLSNGDQYILKKPNGRFEIYIVDPQGELRFNKGITDDQNTRLERLSSEQISKVESITTGDITKLKQDYTKAEIDQQFNDVRNFANSSRINLNGSTVLPVPPRRPDNTVIEDAWAELAQGVTYTQTGGDPITGIEGHRSVAEWDNVEGEWVLVDMGEMPTTPTSDDVTPTGQLAVSEKGVYDYTKPLFDLTDESGNLSDNVFELGGWNPSNGNPITTNNVKRLPTITITEDLVGQHWINGRGILPPGYAYVIVRTTASNPPVISIEGMGGSDDLSPLTFTITSEMVGMMLRLSPGAVAYEPEDGYENHFTWNMGASPMPSFVAKGQLVIKDVYNKKDVDNLLSQKPDEININGKIVRAGDKFDFAEIEGESFGNDSGYYVWNTGNLPSNLAGWKRKLFPVSEADTQIAFTGKLYGVTNVAGVVFFDENMNYLGYDYRVFPNGDQFVSRLLIPTIPQARFVGTTARNAEDEAIIESLTPTGEFETTIFENDLTVEDGAVTKIKGLRVGDSSKLGGKVIVKLGDSIVFAGNAAAMPGFVEQIAQKYNMTVVNHSQGGATITYNGNGVNDIVRQVEALLLTETEPDYIVLNGQTNDINSSAIQLGEISNLFDDTLDRETFTGALEWICRELKRNYPEAKIVYVRVHKMASRPFDKQESFGQRAVEVLNKWSIPIADIYNNGGMNTYLPEMRDMYCIPSSANPSQGDMTHPNTLGYQKWYVPIVESLLTSI